MERLGVKKGKKGNISTRMCTQPVSWKEQRGGQGDYFGLNEDGKA